MPAVVGHHNRRPRIGANARFVQTDMADAESVNSLVQQRGEVDIIVNNAGSFPSALTVDQGMAAFDAMFNTNVRGPYSWSPD